MGRLGPDRWLQWMPAGSELAGMRNLVADDLVADDAVASVAGPDIDVRATEIPRIRPILVALAARATGARAVNQEAQHAAEMLHLALRVHDLALGREGGRRRRMARRLVSRSVEWLSGNHLTLRALELSRTTEHPGVLEELVDTLRSFADAQALSRDLVGRRPELRDWLDHADAHTGALFAFCCRVGGHLAGAPIRQIVALGRYGRHLGRQWHIAEDISAFDQGLAAQHVLSRAASGRPALPLISAIGQTEGIVHEWRELARRPTLDGAERVARAVNKGGLAASREALVRESWLARQSLKVLPDSPYRSAMDRFAAAITKACIRRGR
ncbi:MAG: polyprenyl synthetase family protein [Myxococcota bacterium]